MNIFFEVGVQYTRNDIYNILQVPEEIRRGNWETGYNKYNKDWFIFSNDSIQSMLNPNGNIYLFTRDSNRSPFTFEGDVRVKSYKDTVPVTIVWELIDINERSIERLPEEISNSHLFMEGLKKKKYVNRYELDPINDLKPLCANCHAMIHRFSTPLTIDELRRTLRGDDDF